MLSKYKRPSKNKWKLIYSKYTRPIPLKSNVFPREVCKPKRIIKPFEIIVIVMEFQVS